MSCLTEKELIEIFLAQLPVSKHMQNRFFESDAEVLTGGMDGKLLFTTDEFSDEDHFRTDDPYRLGHNLAVATVSDILAVGGTPYAYAHTVKVSSEWDRRYVAQLAKGIAEVLAACGIGSIGGDIGVANGQWGYTGICMGTSHKPLSRLGAAPGHKIYMTGKVGAGNIEAALSLYGQKPMVGAVARLVKNHFPLRLHESKLIGHWASCCIDTSDGVFAAINTLAALNGVGYRVARLPYHDAVNALCSLLRVPREILFLGECGEYELLFAVPPARDASFLDAAKAADLKFSLIGEFIGSPERELDVDGKAWDLRKYNFSAREFASTSDYLEKLIELLKNER